MSTFRKGIVKHRKVAVPQSLTDVAAYYESMPYLKLTIRLN